MNMILKIFTDWKQKLPFFFFCFALLVLTTFLARPTTIVAEGNIKT